MVNRPSRSAHVALFTVLVLAGFLGAAARPSSSLAAQTSATPAAVEATPAADGTPLATGGQSAWLQVGPNGGLTARAVSAGECPDIVVDGVPDAMGVRAGPSTDFPVTVCETAVPSDAGSVQVDGTSLPLPPADPQRVLVTGDTGCRLRGEDDSQACNDPAAWPFAETAVQGAAWNPDLVIHVGDYLYREQVCPAGNSGCAGSPHGDTWAAWQADFFAPAAPLLAAAPWIFIRGNHEDCNRNGEGWFRFLDPGPMPGACQNFTDPYAVEIGDQQAIVMDAASAQDIEPNDESTAAFREQFAGVERLAGSGSAWLLTHKAFWSLGSDGDGNPIEWTTATYTSAGYLQPPAAIDLIIAGHVHMAQLLWFSQESGRPVEVISGNGGTRLEWFDGGVFTGSDIGDEALIEGQRYREHGFMGLERVEDGWVATVHLLDGTTPASCLIAAKTLDCSP